MLQDDPQPTRAVIDHANPRPFFEGVYRFRSLNAVAAVGVSLFFGGCFAWAAVGSRRIPTSDPILSAVPIAFAVFSIGLFGCAIYLLWGMVVGRVNTLRITQDGIKWRRTSWSWQDVSTLGGVRGSNGIRLECELGQRHRHRTKGFPTTPLLTDEEYSELMRTIARDISLAHPHVDVQTSPREADGGA